MVHAVESIMFLLARTSLKGNDVLASLQENTLILDETSTPHNLAHCFFVLEHQNDMDDTPSMPMLGECSSPPQHPWEQGVSDNLLFLNFGYFI